MGRAENSSVEFALELFSANITDRHHTVSFTRVAVGQRSVPDPKEGFNRLTLPGSAIWNGASGDSRSDEFESGGSVGKIQQLTVSKNEVMELGRSERVKRVDVTAALNRGNGPMNSPLTFESPAAYVVTKLKIYATFEIYFQVRVFLEFVLCGAVEISTADKLRGPCIPVDWILQCLISFGFVFLVRQIG